MTFMRWLSAFIAEGFGDGVAALATPAARTARTRAQADRVMRKRSPKTPKAPARWSSNSNAMRVGIIGSGDVGKSLARGFVSRGHTVTIASRDPARLADFVRDHGERLAAAN